MKLRYIRSSTDEPEENFAREAEILEQVAEGAPPTLLIYVNRPCVILGLNRIAEEDVNLEYCQANGIPVMRRVSGGGTVYHDEGNLNFSIFLNRRHIPGLMSPKQFYAILSGIPIGALGKLGITASLRPLSDIVVGDKKISGTALKITKNAVLYHGTLLLSTPIEAIEATLKIPKERPGISHRDFVTNLKSLGYAVTEDQVAETLLSASEESLFATVSTEQTEENVMSDEQ